jgi:hypothetical protein
MLKRGKLATFEFDSDPETHLIEWAFVPAPEVDDEHQFRPTGLMEKVSRYLEMMLEPQSQRAVEREKFGKAEYVREALRILVAEGYVERTESGRGFLHDSITPYREENESASLSASLVRPFGDAASASLRPTPYRGDAAQTQTQSRPDNGDALTLDEDDGIPF